MRSVEPRPERLQSFTNRAESPAPLVMINLLRYRENAQYPADFHAEPCTGREAYQRYGAVAAKQVAAVGGRVLWTGRVAASVIAPDGEEWDDALLVEYPSRAAFLQMLSEPAYRAAIPHRSAGLIDSRLIATHTNLSALHA
jgi:uncharacterized protein (DUF1330 family)